MDPFALLGVDDSVSEQELAAAFRQQAQRWHPDHEGGDESRMRELNDAYAQARRAVRRRLREKPFEPVARRRPNPGAWLPDAVRKRLGWELLTALDKGIPEGFR